MSMRNITIIDDGNKNNIDLGPKCVFFETNSTRKHNVDQPVAGRFLTLRWFTNVCIIRNDCGARCGLTNKRIIAYREIDFV